jgi:N-acetylmuramoyl-L-alanine amidase
MAKASLERIQLAGTDSARTVQFVLKGRVNARSYYLASPRRLVIELPATANHLRATLPAMPEAVHSLKVGLQPKGALRLVMQLRDGANAVMDTQDRDQSPTLLVRVRSLRGQIDDMAPTPASRPTVPQVVVAAHAPRETGRDIVVAVDAGHGGDDPGASGLSGTQEKQITLAVARRLQARLERESGMHAVLTRDSDQFVPLRDRASKARAAGADLFVSVHADAVRNREVEGASIYVLSERGASSEAARFLADRENKAALRGVPLQGKSDTLASVLVDLSQSAALGSSVEAATMVLNSLDSVGAIRKREVQYAGFAVLKSPDMPSMLVETAYISNPSEEKKLRSANYQDRLADAIAAGVVKYFEGHPPDGTRLAASRRVEGKTAVLALNP